MRTSVRESIRMLRRGRHHADHRSRRSLRSLVAAACLTLFPTALLPASASGQDRFFDVDPLTAAIDGGPANWSDADWKTTVDGTAGVAWASTNTAIFDPVTGTPGPTSITLSGTQTATAVTFNGAGYTLTGGTLALAGTGGSNWINVNANATIQSALTHLRFKGTGEVTISGGGTTTTRGVIGDGTSGLVTVRQTGGTFTIGNSEYLMVGGNSVANSQGAYIMDAGSLTIAQGIYLGWGGSGRTGSFTQNGGTVTTQSGQGLQIGISGGTGAYTLNGGTLISGFGELGSPYSGSFTFGGGTLQTNMSFNTNRQAGVTTSIAAGATARINTNGATVTWSNTLTGASAAGLVKSGSGTLNLNGNFSGDVSVTGGLLQALSATSLGTGTISATGVTSSSGAVDLNGFSFSNPLVIGNRSAGPSTAGALQNTNTSSTSVLDGNVTIGGENYVGGNGSITFNGVVSGGLNNNYALFKQGTGTWTFANENNTFDGFYYQFGGTTAVTKLANLNEASSLGRPTTTAMNRVRFGSGGSGGGTIRFIGSSASNSNRDFVLDGATPAASNRIDAVGTSAAATLTLTGSLSAIRSGAYTAALGGTNAGVNTYAGVIGNGSGTVGLLKDGTTTWSLSGTNTYTGGTTLAAGTLSLGSAGALGATGTITFGGGTLQFTSSNTTDYSGRFSTAANQAYRFDTYGQNVTLASALTSSGGTLFKSGVGTLTLSGTSTFSGATTVNAGTLLMNGNNAGATGAVSVAAGATLGGSGTVGGTATINGTHSPGVSPGRQTFGNGLAYASGSTLVWELSANTALAADRGTRYDGIDLTTAGALGIDPGATLSLVFDQPLANLTPSTVNWNDTFWDGDQQWLIADVSAPVTWNDSVFGIISVGPDSLGAILANVRPNASFSLTSSGGDLTLNYIAVPEPGGWALVAGAAGSMLSWRCRRRTKNPC